MKQANRGSSRLDRVSSLLREEIGRLLIYEVKDPRAREITITTVKVTRDLGIAKVYYLPLQPEDPESLKGRQQRKDYEDALSRVNSFLRRKIGEVLSMRVVPQLRFYWDDAVEHGRRMDSIFAEIADERTATDNNTPDEPQSDE